MTHLPFCVKRANFYSSASLDTANPISFCGVTFANLISIIPGTVFETSITVHTTNRSLTICKKLVTSLNILSREGQEIELTDITLHILPDQADVTLGFDFIRNYCESVNVGEKYIVVSGGHVVSLTH